MSAYCILNLWLQMQSSSLLKMGNIENHGWQQCPSLHWRMCKFPPSVPWTVKLLCCDRNQTYFSVFRMLLNFQMNTFQFKNKNLKFSITQKINARNLFYQSESISFILSCSKTNWNEPKFIQNLLILILRNK